MRARSGAEAVEGAVAFPATLETARVDQSAGVARDGYHGVRGKAAGGEGDEAAAEHPAADVPGAAGAPAAGDFLAPVVVPADAQPQRTDTEAVQASDAEIARDPSNGNRENGGRLQPAPAGADATGALRSGGIVTPGIGTTVEKESGAVAAVQNASDSQRTNTTVTPPAQHAGAGTGGVAPALPAENSGAPHTAPLDSGAPPAATAQPAPGPGVFAEPTEGAPAEPTTEIGTETVVATTGGGTRAHERNATRQRDAGAESSPDDPTSAAGESAAGAGHASTKFTLATAVDRRVQTPPQLAGGGERRADGDQQVGGVETRLVEVESLALREGGRGAQALATVGADRASSVAGARAGVDGTTSTAAWAERVVESLRLTTVRGGGEMRLRLEPEGLGHIDVRVSLAHDGVRAVLVAEHDATRTLLANQQHVLQAALERSELRLAGFSVDLGFGAGSGASADAEGRSGAVPGWPEVPAPDASARVSADSTTIAGPSEPGRLSLRV